MEISDDLRGVFRILRVIRWVIGLAIFGIIAMYFIITGVGGLSKSDFGYPYDHLEAGELCEFVVDYAREICVLDGDHYYYTEQEGYPVKYLVEANPVWFVENFGVDGKSLNGSVLVRGEASGYDRDHRVELERGLDTLPKFTVWDTLYISTGYKSAYSSRLIAGLFSAAAVAACIVIIKKTETVKGELLAAAIIGAAMIVSAFLVFGGF